MSALQIVFTVLGLLVTGGIASWFLIGKQRRKIGADTTKVQVDTAVTLVSAGDERLLRMLTTQTESIVNPLLDEVKGLRAERDEDRAEMEKLREKVAALSEQVRSITHLYRILLGWARTVVAWASAHPHLDPPLPPLPQEIADEL